MTRAHWGRTIGRAGRRAVAAWPARGHGGRGAARGRAVVAAALALALLPALADARSIPGPDPHRADADCLACHTAGAAALRADPAHARTLLVADPDARCMTCHGGEGPSHRTGMPPRKPVPDTLPLSGDGRITCATCHYVHGEGDRSHDYERIDNRRGGLCLTCHTLAELR